MMRYIVPNDDCTQIIPLGHVDKIGNVDSLIELFVIAHYIHIVAVPRV